VEPPKQILTPEQIFNVAVEKRPEIKSADLRVQAAEKSLAIARGILYPSLSLSGSWGTGYSGASKEINPDVSPTLSSQLSGYAQKFNDTVKTPVYTYSVNYSLRVKSFYNQLRDNNNQSIGFYLRIPLFNGWQTRTNISLAKIQEDQAEVNLEISKRDLRKSIEQSYADAVAALKKYNSSLQKVTAQEESFKYTQQKFDVGMLTSFDFNTAKKDLTTAQSDLLQAKYDFIFKTTIIDFYMGNPISIK
jgi:outer membrane protein